MHHRLLSLHRKGAFAGMREPIAEGETFLAFCAMLPAGCFCWEEGREDYPHLPSCGGTGNEEHLLLHPGLGEAADAPGNHAGAEKLGEVDIRSFFLSSPHPW
jgi:hypothetical protein